MDPTLWTGLKGNQTSGRTGVGTGPELALSLQPSLAQPAINNTVNLEIWALLDRQQRIAASGLAAGFLPQPAILTPSYGTSASFGTQYATATNNLYHYNTLPVAQPVLTGSYDGSSLLTSQQQSVSKNDGLADQYKAHVLVQQSSAQNNTTNSAVTLSSKPEAATRSKKTGAYPFSVDQPSRPGGSMMKTYDNGGLGPRIEGVKMVSPSLVSAIPSSISQNDFASTDLTYRQVLGLNQQQSSTHATTRAAVHGLVLTPNDFNLEQFSANSCLDLSQFSKPDASSKTYAAEPNFQNQDLSMLSAESLLSFGHPCEIMSAVNMSSNKESVANSGTGQSQQSRQHPVTSRVSTLSWPAASQYCGQQDANSMSTNMTGSANVVAYEAVSPPPSSETQSFSFVDSLHLYPETVQVKDLLSSAYELTENQIYVKSLCDMPLIYAAQSSGNDGVSQVSSVLQQSQSMPAQQTVTSVVEGSDKARQIESFVARSVAGDQENGRDRSRRQKTKPAMEVGVVLPMPQSKPVRRMSSNPLTNQYELTIESRQSEQQQHPGFETIQYGTESISGNQLSMHNYKPDVQQKVLSPYVTGTGKHNGFTAGLGSCSDVSGEAHSTPIVLTNITGNVYVNQYTMLQPSNVPLVNQDTTYQTVTQYEHALKSEPEKPEHKSCSVLLVPDANDDELGHLSVDPTEKQLTSANNKPGSLAFGAVPAPPSLSAGAVATPNDIALSKAKAAGSTFENSYMSFVQGHKSETLSSVTNSPIKNRPVLPKYIPDVRKPRADAEKLSMEAGDCSSSQKSGASSGTNAENVGKVGNDVAVVTNSGNSALDNNSSVSVFSSTGGTKFPPKFSHKLLGRAQMLNVNAKADNTEISGKEKCDVTTEFKWKKVLSTELGDVSKGSISSSKPSATLPSPTSSDQGSKRKLSASSTPSDAAASKTPQVQWTVSKKSKLKKTESSNLPILVIKAVSGNQKDDKNGTSPDPKSMQVKNSNSAGKNNAK